jgi:hypothetical protein
MSIPTPKVELGFDLSSTGNGPFFVLDNPQRGLLDGTSFVLAGELFYDVTDDVRSIAIKRGKNRLLDNVDPGLANIVFNNHDRKYDPLNISSPFATQIIPKRQVRISVNDEPMFYGLVDDWNFEYDISGDSVAAAAVSDAFTAFTSTTLTAGTSITQLSGARVNAVLSDPNVLWPAESRDINTGGMTLGPDVIAADSNVLEYLRKIESSEPGIIFMSKDGKVTFRDRNVAPTSTNTVAFADDGTGIPYIGLKVQYGSELLANEVQMNSVITGSTAIAFDAESISIYGSYVLNLTDLLVNSDDDLIDLAVFLASKYSAPEYRFESLDLILNDLTTEQVEDLLGLEIGDPCVIRFTPNKTGAEIIKYAQVIRIDHSMDPEMHMMSLGFATLDFTTFVLNDEIFGKLDSGNRLSL